MNKKLLEGLESLKLDIRSGVANWGGKVYYFNEKDKAELIAEIDKFNPFERLAKPKKTLEELGYTNEMDEHGFVCWRRHYRNSLEHDKFINMYEDGHITFNTFMELTKEDYEAIGYEMKKRGWWK